MVGHKVSINVHHQHNKRAASVPKSCNTGGFYKSPTANSVFNLSSDSLNNATITVEWDPACLPKVKEQYNDLADIYLYNPSAKDTPLLHSWYKVPFSAGTANLQLNPNWPGWNKNKTITLQLAIAPRNVLPFMTGLSPSPFFTVNYDDSKPPSLASTSFKESTDYSGDDVKQEVAERELSKGKIAAGVLIPLLFIALAIFGYIKFQRRKARKAREEWTEKVDRRMSVVSQDWKSMTVTGAQAGIRASMAGSAFNVTDGGVGVRRSNVGDIRPVSSVYAPEMNGAGVGANHGGYQYHVEVGPDGEPVASPTSADYLKSRSPGVGLRSTAYSNAQIAQRVSRVSFADSVAPRPSGETRRSGYSAYERKSRAFHQGHVPPVPNRSTQYAEEDLADVSPKQRDGARTLTPDDIHSRAISAASVYADEGSDDVAPALSMMRAQAAELNAHIYSPDEQAQYDAMPSFPVPSVRGLTSPTFGDATLFTASPVTATFPPTATSPFSPNAPLAISPMSPTTTLPAMSPDDMLRAYAERAKSPPIAGGISRGPTPVSTTGRGRSGTVTMMGGLGGPATINTAVEPVGNGVMSPTRGAYGVMGEEHSGGVAK